MTFRYGENLERQAKATGREGLERQAKPNQQVEEQSLGLGIDDTLTVLYN